MNVTIAFPPSLCLPNQIYYALPLLAGALRQAGHEPRIVDLNALAADAFLTHERAERYLGLGYGLAERFDRAGSRGEASGIRKSLAAMDKKVRDAPGCKEDLRDRERFFDKPRFRHAFWNVVDALGFFYQLDPIISTHRETFARDVIENQERDAWTPLQELYEEVLVGEVLRDAPALVGLCVAFPEQAVEAVRLARRLRARAPGVHICLGGPLISLYPDKWLEDGWLLRYCDSVCVGDGESAIVELAEAVAGKRGLDQVRNLAYRDARGVLRRPAAPVIESLASAPLPDFTAADMGVYMTPRPIYPVMLSRGCYWGRCTFCSIGWRENFRLASAENVRRDVADLASRYGARYLQVQDSSVPPKAALTLSEAIRESGADLHWCGGMKFERVFLDAGYCREIGAGGCRSLLMGFESATQRVVDLMDKGFRVDDVPSILSNLREAGVSAELLWFIGFPSETRGEALKTARWLLDHRALFGLPAFVSEYQLHPDTMIYDRPAEFGLRVGAQDNGAYRYVSESGMQIDELQILKRLLADTNNRTLTCNGSHLPHLVERGIDLTGLERPMVVSDELVAYCGAEPKVEPALAASPGSIDRPAFFDDDFGFRSRLEALAPVIRSEWARVPPAALRLWPEPSAFTGQWATLGLIIAGHQVEGNCRMCPRTAEFLEQVPNLYSAGFSVLGPRSSLPRHVGVEAGVLRCHLGIVIPPDCGMRIGEQVIEWEEGRTIVFDDTIPHEAWNRSPDPKVVLLIDFAPPWLLDDPTADVLARRKTDRDYYRAIFPEWT